MKTGEWLQDPGMIIASSAIGEKEGKNLLKEMRQESVQSSEA